MSVGYLGNAFADMENALAAGKRGVTLTADQMRQVLDVTAAVVEANNELVRENERLRGATTRPPTRVMVDLPHDLEG